MISHTLFYAYHCTFFRLSPLGTECNSFLSSYQSITTYLASFPDVGLNSSSSGWACPAIPSFIYELLYMISHILSYVYYCTFFRLSPLGTECNFFLSSYQSITTYLVSKTTTTTLSPLLMITFIWSPLGTGCLFTLSSRNQSLHI